jgi:hypothetical protein
MFEAKSEGKRDQKTAWLIHLILSDLRLHNLVNVPRLFSNLLNDYGVEIYLAPGII